MTSDVVATSNGHAVGTVLEPRLVGEVSGHFFVPAYQRGYRWGDHEVVSLLNDIEHADGKYFLQPVVVKHAGSGWELIDGQQRLTTLYLILQYIREHLPTSNAGYSLEYETRPQSAAYLDDPSEEASYENIDFFHIFRASRRIREWFESKPDPVQAAIDFRTALTKSVYVIWYEAPSDLDSRTLFTRLNVGRIPLTDAELVKAVLLSKVDRPHEVAAQWDAIERDLRVPEVWSFVTGRTGQEATHIELLLDTIAGEPAGTTRPLFHTFERLRERMEASSAEEVWNKVVDLHSLVLGWYNHRDLFHKVGYLVADGVSFSSLVASASELTRTSLERSLDERIRERINVSHSGLADLSYEQHYAKCERVLLLMNVETVRRQQHSFERYSFSAHAKRGWTLEHIHAQSAETLNKAEQWIAWLTLHRDALRALPSLDDDARADLIDRIDQALESITQDKFRYLEPMIVNAFNGSDPTSDDPTHSIANLALLAGDDNSALNNSCFEVKRQHILRLDRDGSYIPAATRKVFLKYYTPAAAQQVHFWGPQDRHAYFGALADAIAPYLSPEGDDAE